MNSTSVSRRAFLVTSAATLTGVAAYEHGAHAATPARIAIAGFGRRGTWLARCLAGDPRAVVVAVCDPAPAAHTLAEEVAPSARYRTWDDILAAPDVDGVVLAVPEACRGTMAVEALDCGKHVWSEAPAAMTSSEWLKMERAAAIHGRLFETASHSPFVEHWKMAGAVVRAGAIGAVTRVQSRLTSGVSPAPDGDSRLARGLWRKQRETSLGAAAESLHHQWSAMASVFEIPADAGMSVAGGCFSVEGGAADSLLVETRSGTGVPIIVVTSPLGQSDYVHIRGARGEIEFAMGRLVIRNSAGVVVRPVPPAASPLDRFLHTMAQRLPRVEHYTPRLVLRAIAQLEQMV